MFVFLVAVLLSIIGIVFVFPFSPGLSLIPLGAMLGLIWYIGEEDKETKI